MTEPARPPAAALADSTGMKYLDTLPQRVVTVYIPLALFLIILLFPFYWMGVTTFKPNDELYNFADHNPFWITSPTLQNIRKLLFDRLPAMAAEHHDDCGVRDGALDLRQRARRICDHAL